MYFHGLTDQIPKSIYLNFEQPPKNFLPGELEQNRIDQAFARPMRVSNNVATYEELRIFLLNGMYTGNFGVVDIEGPEGEKVATTSLERTLIDITVRPAYSGGVFEVLKAYKAAQGQFSVNKLSAMLKTLGYTYPYHQAIGFYLERAGYKQKLAELLKQKFEIKYDFHLTHQMKDPEYSESWRLYYPKGF